MKFRNSGLNCINIERFSQKQVKNKETLKKPKRKGPYGPVGIKNSWKYEKDLIILNVIYGFFTINQLYYIL